jgi:hypothetical protein
MVNKPSSKKQEVSIQRPKRQVMELLLKSQHGSTLICNRRTERSMNKIKDKHLGKHRPKDGPKDIKELFEDSLYSVNGTYGFPASGFKKSIVRAAPFANFTESFLRRAGIYVLGEIIPFTKCSKPRMRENDFPPVGRGGSDWRIRGEFEWWEIKVQILFNSNVMTIEQIAGLFDIAGFHIGIGDWRPDSPHSPTGSHGLYEVVMSK